MEKFKKYVIPGLVLILVPGAIPLFIAMLLYKVTIKDRSDLPVDKGENL